MHTPGLRVRARSGFGGLRLKFQVRLALQRPSSERKPSAKPLSPCRRLEPWTCQVEEEYAKTMNQIMFEAAAAAVTGTASATQSLHLSSQQQQTPTNPRVPASSANTRPQPQQQQPPSDNTLSGQASEGQLGGGSDAQSSHWSWGARPRSLHDVTYGSAEGCWGGAEWFVEKHDVAAETLLVANPYIQVGQFIYLIGSRVRVPTPAVVGVDRLGYGVWEPKSDECSCRSRRRGRSFGAWGWGARSSGRSGAGTAALPTYPPIHTVKVGCLGFRVSTEGRVAETETSRLAVCTTYTRLHEARSGSEQRVPQTDHFLGRFCTQRALNEIRWLVNDLKKLELFKLVESVPGAVLSTTKPEPRPRLPPGAPVTMEGMVPVPVLTLGQFEEAQASRVQAAVQDIVQVGLGGRVGVRVGVRVGPGLGLGLGSTHTRRRGVVRAEDGAGSFHQFVEWALLKRSEQRTPQRVFLLLRR